MSDAIESFVAADNIGDASGVASLYSSPVMYDGTSRTRDWLYGDLAAGWAAYPDHEISLTSSPTFISGPTPEGSGWSGTIQYTFTFTGTGVDSGEFACRDHVATDQVRVDSSGDVVVTSHRTDSTEC